MARTLKAVKPEVIEISKPKILLSGKPKVGKTSWAIEWPKPYMMDIEGGAVRPQYREKLIEVGGMYFGKEQGSQDFKTVIEEIITLATVKHDYLTLIIDSFTFLYNMAAAIAEEKVGNDFGKDKKEANKPTRQLLRWIEALDMNVILICHQKEKWARANGQLVNDGTTFDGLDKMEYMLDLWLEATKSGDKRSVAVRASRVSSLPEGLVLPFNFSDFSKTYSEQVIGREPKQYQIASEEQVKEMQRLESILKLEDDVKQKWLTKGGADSWQDMKSEDLQKCIDFLKKQLTEAK